MHRVSKGDDRAVFVFGNCQQFMVIFIRRKYNAKEFMANGIPFGIHGSFF